MEKLSLLEINKNTIELDPTDKKKYYVKDMKALKGKEPNLKWYMKYCDLVEMWIDANPRNTNDVIDLLMTGADKVVLNPKFLTEKELKEILEMSEDIALKIDEYHPELLEIFKKYGGEYIVIPLNLIEKFLDDTFHVLVILPEGQDSTQLDVWGCVYERTEKSDSLYLENSR